MRFLVDNALSPSVAARLVAAGVGVRRAIAAAHATGVALAGVRLDSGDLLELYRQTRVLLDTTRLSDVRIVASGDLEERRIAELVAAAAPIDSFGVGTDLGTSRDSPVVNGIYKLVADRAGGSWRDVHKRSPEKATVPGAKQVFRDYDGGEMRDDLIARAQAQLPGRPLLVPFVRRGPLVREDVIVVVKGIILRATAHRRAGHY